MHTMTLPMDRLEKLLLSCSSYVVEVDDSIVSIYDPSPSRRRLATIKREGSDIVLSLYSNSLVSALMCPTRNEPL